MKKIRKKFSGEERMMVYVSVALSILFVVLFYFVYVYSPNSLKLSEPIEIDIIKIDANCEDCFDTDFLLNQVVKEFGFGVGSEEVFDYDSEDGRRIVEKYGVKSVPAIILVSEKIEDIPFDRSLFVVGETYALFDKSVPSIDIETGEKRGLVQLVEIKPSDCLDCTSPSNLKSSFEKLGVRISDYEILESASGSGSKIIAENNLTFVPALLISKNIEDYWWVFDKIKPSLKELEDYFLFAMPLAPYVDVPSGSLRGVVDITYLENFSCFDCFNATRLGDSFKNLGVYAREEVVVDVSSSEGKNLLKKYNITAIPTVILSSGIGDYPQLKQILSRSGTFDSEGYFVFREIGSLGPNIKYQEIEL